MSPPIFYGCVGLSVALISNAIRKVPLMRQPWDHVIYFGIGTFIGSNIESYKTTKRQEIAEVRAERAKVAQDRKERIAARVAAGEL